MVSSELESIARGIREDIVRMTAKSGSGHMAAALGLADIFTILFFKVLNFTPEDPRNPQRDRFVLSCGHVCPVYYATLAARGFFHRDELWRTRQLGSPLQGHPDRRFLSFLETSSGSLGQGLSIAVGMALALRLDKLPSQVFCVTSDGEHQEGQLWEAVMLAGKEKLSNLVNIIDRNSIQISGNTEDVMPLEPLRSKYEAYNWRVVEMDGNSLEEIELACREARFHKDGPVAIIAHTIPGKGVKFMENDYRWHDRPFESEEQLEKAIRLIQNAKR